MFQAVPCSSSGGQIALLQHLVWSFSVNGHTVCWLRADRGPLSTSILYSCLQRVTIPEAVVIQFCPPEDEQHAARNMWRIIV